MPQHFEQELEGLKQLLVDMAAHAREAVTQATKALIEHDGTLARRVIENDRILDQFEIDIDDVSIHLLTKAPLATDLRCITIAMKISHDLERVGDEATSIARRSLELSQHPEFTPNLDLHRMSSLALEMLQDAIQSYVARDPVKARTIIPRDKEVDSLYKQTYRLLTSYTIESPHTITCCLYYTLVAKSLERVADHATNIAEEVVFLCEGRDIRHNLKLKAGMAGTEPPGNGTP